MMYEEQLYAELKAIQDEYSLGRMSFDEFIELQDQIMKDLEGVD